MLRFPLLWLSEECIGILPGLELTEKYILKLIAHGPSTFGWTLLKLLVPSIGTPIATIQGTKQWLGNILVSVPVSVVFKQEADQVTLPLLYA